MQGRQRMQRRSQNRKRMCQVCFESPAGYKRPRDGAIVSDRDHDMCQECFLKALKGIRQ